MSNIFAVIGLAFLLIYITLKFLKRRRLPPGPWALPFIGNYRGYNGSVIYKKMFQEYMPKYGKLITLFWGNDPIVFINDYKLTTEALGNKHGKSLAGRKNVQTEDIVSEERQNIFGNDYGPLWREMVRALKIGVTKCSLTVSFERNIQKSVNLYCESLFKNPENSDKGIYPFDESYWLSDNVVLSIVIGRIFELDDDEYKTLQDSRRQVFDIMDKSEYINWIPFGRYLPLPCIKQLTEQSKKLNKLLAKFVNDVREKGQYRTNPDNIMEYLLHDIENRKNDEDREVILSDVNIRQIFKDMLFASYEGIGLTNIWYIALLALHPKIQERIRKDIKEFCKKKNDFTPKFEWRSELSYIQAVEFEFFRYSSIVGILDFHCAMKSVKLGEYNIPKGCLIAVNQYALNHDPERWKNPEVVQPERFLDDNGKFSDRPDLTTFGMGIRMCPGTVITKGYGFLLLCNLCLNYKIDWSTENEFDHLEDDPDNAVLFRSLKDYFVKISKV